MEVVLGALAVGLVLLIAAWALLRESTRFAAVPPRPLFDMEQSLQWVVTNLADDAAAVLTVDEVRVILDLQMQFFRAKGVSGNGHGSDVPGPVVVGGSETVGWILERALAQGLEVGPAEVHAVLDTQVEYLRSIGAVGPEAGDSELGPRPPE